MAYRSNGLAFGGDRGVSRVEVSVDDGGHRQDAKLDYPGTELSWALWSHNWRPESAGDYRLVVQATNLRGELQAFDEKRPKNSGPTGLHKITVHVA